MGNDDTRPNGATVAAVSFERKANPVVLRWRLVDQEGCRLEVVADDEVKVTVEIGVEDAESTSIAHVVTSGDIRNISESSSGGRVFVERVAFVAVQRKDTDVDEVTVVPANP